MNEPTQYVNVVYFDEDASKLENQMETFEKFRTRYVQTWGHLLNEHGLYWGREVGKHERLWAVAFLKDKHSQGIAQNTAEYESWKADTDKLVPVRLLNVPVQGAMPLHEVLQAGVVVLSYYKLAADRSAARFEELSKRFRDEVGCPEFRGGALISPTGLGGDAVSFGAWDSVEACLQLGVDGRYADLLAEMNEAFDTTERTLITFVKFQKHVIS